MGIERRLPAALYRDRCVSAGSEPVDGHAGCRTGRCGRECVLAGVGVNRQKCGTRKAWERVCWFGKSLKHGLPVLLSRRDVEQGILGACVTWLT